MEWIPGKPLDFRMTFALGGTTRWRYTREQWHRLRLFASRITLLHQEQRDKVPYATYLEFLLFVQQWGFKVPFEGGLGPKRTLGYLPDGTRHWSLANLQCSYWSTSADS